MKIIKKCVALIVFVLILGSIKYQFIKENNYEMESQKIKKEQNYDEMIIVETREEESGNMEKNYGAYRIAQFCPTIFYTNRRFDVLPEQEADMLIGRVVQIEEEIFSTYDSERRLGTRDERKAFPGNYMIKEFSLQNPQYNWEILDAEVRLDEIGGDDMRRAIGDELFEKINGRISIHITASIGKHEYYTMKDGDKLILHSDLTEQYFILEKLDKIPEKREASILTDTEREHILKSFYGTYIIKEFLPTKFYPALDSSGVIILPQEEANMMLGKIITINEDESILYDNCRLPNSGVMKRGGNEYRLEEMKICNPDYQLKNVLRNEIYGLRDNMLPEELEQDEYTQINVYPGYNTGGVTVLPQFYMLNDGRIIIYSMGEYFLLEKE